MTQKFLIGSILTGLLLSLSWYFPFQLLIFGAFVPLFWLEKHFFDHKLPAWKLYFLTFLAFLIWNVGTTWWIWNATPPASVAAFVANSFLQSLPVLFFHILKKIQTIVLAIGLL